MKSQDISFRGISITAARSISVSAPMVDLLYQALIIAFTLSQGGTIPIITIISVIHSLLNFIAAMKSNEIYFKDMNKSPATSFLGITAQYFTSLSSKDKTYENQIKSEFVGSFLDVIDTLLSYLLPSAPGLNTINLIGDLILLQDSFLSYQDLIISDNVLNNSISYNKLETSISSESSNHDNYIGTVEASQMPILILRGCTDEEFYYANDEFENIDGYDDNDDDGGYDI